YMQVVLENEFLYGYSGARTFLVRPIRPDGCEDALTIVKIGPSEAIRQEFSNYEAFVKDRLPPVTARIQRPPLALSSYRRAGPAQRAAMQYTFIAEPGRSPVSLRNALHQNPDPALLQQLFETFGPNWWMQRRTATFRVETEYDRLLPPHYVLQPCVGTRPRNVKLAPSEKTDPASLHLEIGDYVLLKPFQQIELRADGKSYSLIGIPQSGRPSLRLRWLDTHSPHVNSVVAQVSATRMSLLNQWTTSFDRFGLPDPTPCLAGLLDQTLTGTRSVIHGDLNLENVLVGPGSLVWLIDFALTREGHPLFDFAHLESELISHILAERAASPRAYLALWRSREDPLLNALHAIAGRCLFDPAHPREYNLALCMACMGALKYQNLSPLAKHCLYLTAADLSTSL
ncbi:MAG: phosphotransferase, partial [Anaerolineaceae bacterium]|nr:phosphotransferase [Anaerolineaceae bacterium]